MYLKIGIVVGFVMIASAYGFVYYYQTPSDLLNDNNNVDAGLMPSRNWQPVLLGDADPGGDASGFMYFMAYPHQADPATAYASNLSNSTAYEYSDSLNSEMTNETPHSTTFDLVVKFRVNDTVGYNTSSSKWETTWVRANITVDFDFATDVGADTAMTIVMIANGTNFAWYHGWIADSDGGAGAGFQITHNEKYNVTSVTADGYY